MDYFSHNYKNHFKMSSKLYALSAQLELISYLPKIHNVSISTLLVLIGISDNVRIPAEKLPMQILIVDFNHVKILHPVYFYKILKAMQNNPIDI